MSDPVALLSDSEIILLLSFFSHISYALQDTLLLSLPLPPSLSLFLPLSLSFSFKFVDYTLSLFSHLNSAITLFSFLFFPHSLYCGKILFPLFYFCSSGFFLFLPFPFTFYIKKLFFLFLLISILQTHTNTHYTHTYYAHTHTLHKHAHTHYTHTHTHLLDSILCPRISRCFEWPACYAFTINRSQSYKTNFVLK